MATKYWNAEGGTVGVDLTGINQGSSDPITVLKTGAATLRITSTAGQVLRGSQSGRVNTAVGEVAYGYFAESGTIGQKGVRGKFNFPSAPSTDILIMSWQAASGTAMGIQLRTTGRIAVVNANAGTGIAVSSNDNAGALSGDIAVPFPTGDFTVDAWCDLGTTGSLNTGDSEAHVDVYRHAVSTSTPWKSWDFTAAGLGTQNFASKGVAITQERIGNLTSAAAVLSFDEFRVVDGRTLQGTAESPVNAPPVVTPPGPVQILTGTKPTLTMVATDPEGGTLTPTWAPNIRPSGATAATVSYPSGDHKVMTTAANLTNPGRWTFTPSASDGTNTTAGADAEVFVAAADGTAAVSSIEGTMTGTAADVNDTSAANYLETTAAPAGLVEVLRFFPKAAGSAFRYTHGGYRNPSGGLGVHVKCEILAGVADTVIKTVEWDAEITDTDRQIDLTTGELAAFAAAGGYNRPAVRNTYTQLP